MLDFCNPTSEGCIHTNPSCVGCGVWDGVWDIPPPQHVEHPCEDQSSQVGRVCKWGGKYTEHFGVIFLLFICWRDQYCNRKVTHKTSPG